MCDKEDKDMFATKRKSLKKPVIENKFSNLSKKDWKESNEASKENRGASGFTYRDIYGR
jgi:hypothetical protein